LYGQLIAGPPDKIVITGTPTQQVSWSPALLHRKIEQPVLDKLLEACLEISEVHTRREWVVHPLPRHLVLTGSEVIQSLVHGKLVDSDIVDSAMRRFNQMDGSIQCSGVAVRWWHFFESDFAVMFLYRYHPLQGTIQFSHISLVICKLISRFP